MKDAIRNPANPEHLMVVQPVGRRVRVFSGQLCLADTEHALRVIEINQSVYPPRLYFPMGGLRVTLAETAKTTHCPLKGDARYFELDGMEIAWAYETFDFADVLKGHVSFWEKGLRFIEGE